MRRSAPIQWLALACIIAIAAGCNRDEPADALSSDPTPSRRIDVSLVAAARFLVSAQSPDGAWRSSVYGPMKDGPSLTPHVLASLFFLQQGGEPARESFHRGAEYLSTLLDKDGHIDAALRFPVYSAAAASWVVRLERQDHRTRAQQAAWIEYLRARQLNSSLGWTPDDPQFGGWGYSVSLPRKPAGQAPDPLADSNISATVYALGALRCANIPADDPVYGQILTCVKRCQNFSDDPQRSDPRFDDGGFFFMPNDAARNKAGPSGTDRLGRRRFHSYGSATADGLRALLHAGLPPSHPRVIAAEQWLELHFDPSSNPGTFEPDRQVLRNATYYYYVWSVSHAFMHLGLSEVGTTTGTVNWTESLATQLLRRQNPDGSWSNSFTDAKEDDPLVATSYAAAALAICRKMIAERRGVPPSLCHHLPVSINSGLIPAESFGQMSGQVH